MRSFGWNEQGETTAGGTFVAKGSFNLSGAEQRSILTKGEANPIADDFLFIQKDSIGYELLGKLGSKGTFGNTGSISIRVKSTMDFSGLGSSSLQNLSNFPLGTLVHWS